MPISVGYSEVRTYPSIFSYIYEMFVAQNCYLEGSIKCCNSLEYAEPLKQKNIFAL